MESNPIKILIADDEPDIIEIISFHLVKAGYDVISAKDGSEAIEKAKQQEDGKDNLTWGEYIKRSTSGKTLI